MLIRLPFVLLACAVFAGYAAPAGYETRAKLYGQWKADSGSEDAGIWTLQPTGEALKVTHSVGEKKVTEFECATTGEECSAKVEGKSVKVSLYYNGAKLVELETRGKEIVKRRFSLGDQEDSLQLEVIPVSYSGKTETVKFTRVKK